MITECKDTCSVYNTFYTVHYALPCSISKGALPVHINLDPTSFVPGPHTITIVANSATGEVATFSYDFIVPDIIGTSIILHANQLFIKLLNIMVKLLIDFRCIQLMEPGRTVVVCKTSKPDAISECGLMGSFENTTIISLLTPDYFMGIRYNCNCTMTSSSIKGTACSIY